MVVLGVLGAKLEWSRRCIPFGVILKVTGLNFEKDNKMAQNQNPGNFANDREKAAEAGHKGGQHSGGNFKNDHERAAEAGQKGGQASGGNFKNDHERAAEAGHKGGSK